MINPTYPELNIAVSSGLNSTDTLADSVSVTLSDNSVVEVSNSLADQPEILSLGTTLGIKESGKPDFAVIMFPEPSVTVAMFTKNRCPSVTVLRNRECLANAQCQLIAVNSGNANVFTPHGESDLNEIVSLLSKEFGVEATQILMCSTGVIGVPLPMERFRRGISGLKACLQSDGLHDVATAIMTTDRHPKSCSIRIGDVVIAGIAKGAGMIEPNMATMLVYIITNASIDAETLQGHLQFAVENSFNRISIDSDTSTSDTVTLSALGAIPASSISGEDFRRALTALCIKLARDVVSQGEGVEKILECSVQSETSVKFSRQVAKQIVNSPLFKCAMHGGDPNWGRIVMAIGKGWTEDSPTLFKPEMLSVSLQDVPVLKHGAVVSIDLAKLAHRIKSERVIEIAVTIGKGGFLGRAWGADLTAEYVAINADYTT
jgi:glutamate N-acetyltransferase/amino-acid N-acetyltransferase